MPQKRITIISAIHGKLTYEHKVCEPDMAWIIEKWLDRHPEIRRRRKDTGRDTMHSGEQVRRTQGFAS